MSDTSVCARFAVQRRNVASQLDTRFDVGFAVSSGSGFRTVLLKAAEVNSLYRHDVFSVMSLTDNSVLTLE